MKLMTKAIAVKLAMAYTISANTGKSGKDVIVKYFDPTGAGTWYISEGMPVDAGGEPCTIEAAKDYHLFGYCDLGMGCPELGYVLLSDLERIRGRFGLGIERDRNYENTLEAAMAA